MTGFKTVSVTCPACGNEGSFDHYASVNVTLDPSLKERVLDSSLFTFKCEHCGASALVEAICLYHDMKEKLLFQLAPGTNSDAKEKDVLKKINDSDAGLSFSNEGYRIRIVTSLNDLKEKIAISDAQLDDRIVELLKIGIEAVAMEQIEGEGFVDVRFLSREGDELSFGVLGSEGPLYKAVLSTETYEEEALQHDFADDEERYLIDREWALRKIGLLEEGVQHGHQ